MLVSLQARTYFECVTGKRRPPLWQSLRRDTYCRQSGYLPGTQPHAVPQ